MMQPAQRCVCLTFSLQLPPTQVGNVVAYGYAPASIVTPMGAVGVLTNVVITTYVLREPFSKWNLLGVFGVVGGIIMVVYYAPKATIILHADTIWRDLIATPQFLAYAIVFVTLLAFLLSIGRKYGEKSVFVYVGTCSVIASLTIVASKTFSTIVAESLAAGDGSHWKYPAPYVSLLLMVGTAVVSMGYVNSAMMHFGNSIVVPTYYAMFTISSVAAVALVYREFDCMTELGPALAFGGGLILTVLGVCLLQSGKTDVVRLEEEEEGGGAGSDLTEPFRPMSMSTIPEEFSDPTMESNMAHSGTQGASIYPDGAPGVVPVQEFAGTEDCAAALPCNDAASVEGVGGEAAREVDALECGEVCVTVQGVSQSVEMSKGVGAGEDNGKVCLANALPALRCGASPPAPPPSHTHANT